MKSINQLLVLLVLATSVSAWWGKGHLLVARIAYDILEKEDPQIITKVENILDYLRETDPYWTKKEGEYSFVECTTFADDIKNKGGNYQQGWHFIDNPYLDTPGDKITDYPNFVFDIHNITAAISEIVAWFNRDPGYKDGYAYQQVVSHEYNTTEESSAVSTAMRLLIHYCGDIHQPLHCTSRVDKNYPIGDRGGNDVPIPEIEGTGVDNLHQVWDSVIYEFYGYADLPYNDAGWADLGNHSQTVQDSYPVDPTKAKNLNPFYWAAESFKFDQDFVYDGVVENQAVSDEYKAAGKKIAYDQIVLAGNRLANLLRSLKWPILRDNEEPVTMKEELIEFLGK